MDKVTEPLSRNRFMREVMKVHKFSDRIEYWYDRSPRVWYAMITDDEGNQICDVCPDAYTREEILEICADMLENPTPYLDYDCRGGEYDRKGGK